MLGLVDGNGPTPLARTVAGLGLSPRLGVLAVRGAAIGQKTLASACAALLQERDGSEISRDPDFRLRLELIRSGRGGTDSWRRAVETEMGRILRRLPAAEAAAYGWTEEQETRVGSLLAAAFPDRLTRREPDGSYRLVTGRMARFPSSGSAAFGRVTVPSRAAGPWVVALDAEPGETVGAIRLAAPVAREDAESALAIVAEETVEIRWEGLVPKGELVRRAGRLVLTERPARLAPEQVSGSFLTLLRERGLAPLPWNAQSTRLLARMRFYSRARADMGAGDFSDDGLAARVDEWLTPHLKLSGGHVITAGGLAAALKALAAAMGRIDTDVPESLTLPTGGVRAIDYDGPEPSVEARIQEVFGLARSPRICGVPLTFPASLAIAPAFADHAGPRELLARDLCGGAQGDARALSETLLAGGPSYRRTDNEGSPRGSGIGSSALPGRRLLFRGRLSPCGRSLFRCWFLPGHGPFPRDRSLLRNRLFPGSGPFLRHGFLFCGRLLFRQWLLLRGRRFLRLFCDDSYGLRRCGSLCIGGTGLRGVRWD